MSRKNNNGGQPQGGYSVNYGGQPQGGYSVEYGSGQQGGYDAGNGGYYVTPGYDPNTQQMTAAPQPEMSGGRKVLSFLGRSVTITFKYFAAKALICLIMGALSWVIFRMLKIPYAGLFAIVLGIGNMIPVIGEWAAAAVICIPLLLMGEARLTLYAAIVMLVLEGIDDFILTPLIVGRSLSFKPIIVLLMTIAISIMGGPIVGVALAIPAIAIVKLFLDIFWFKKGMDDRK